MLELFGAFFRIGLFTIGGGMAMLPLLKKEAVENHGWITEEEMIDYYALAQSSPGIIAVNTAVYVGYKHKGTRGALAATLGIVAPSWLIIIAVAAVFSRIDDLAVVRKAFAGIRIVVTAMILNTVIDLGKRVVRTRWDLVFMLAAFTAIVGFGVATPWVVLGAGLAGLAVMAAGRIAERRQEG